MINSEKAVEKTGFGKFQLRLSILTGMAWMADAMEVFLNTILVYFSNFFDRNKFKK